MKSAIWYAIVEKRDNKNGPAFEVRALEPYTNELMRAVCELACGTGDCVYVGYVTSEGDYYHNIHYCRVSESGNEWRVVSKLTPSAVKSMIMDAHNERTAFDYHAERESAKMAQAAANADQPELCS